MLVDLLPDCAALADTIRVIDVPRSTGGQTLQVLMNGESDEALALLTFAKPEPAEVISSTPPAFDVLPRPEDSHWQWRLRMIERLASLLDPERFGVRALYLFGSTKNATAGPKSDIDLLIHFRGSEEQLEQLILWLEGWSLCLAEINYSRTGCQSEGLIDYHILTDDDIAKKSSYAVKIGATTDAARPLTLKKAMLG
jgi:hypothetical protein